MKNRKIVAVVVAASMVLSLAGCSKTGKKDDKAQKAVISTAEDFSEALVNLDASNFDDLTNLEDEDLEMCEMIFGMLTEDDEDVEALLDAVLDEISFEIDEDSIEIDDDEASVDVVFTHLDGTTFEDLAEDCESIDDLIDALDDADTKESTVSYELELNDDDEWVISNADKAIEKYFDKVFDFGNFDPSMFSAGGSIVDAFDGYTWYACDPNTDDVYTNASYIDFWGTYNAEMMNYESPEVYFTVERDGVLIYTSEERSSLDFYYYASDDADSVDGYLPAGTYTVTCYDLEDNLVATGTCTVIAEAAEETTTTAADTPVAGDDDFSAYWSDPSSEWSDTISSWGWYDVAGQAACDGVFTLGNPVEYDLVTEDADAGDLYFAFYPVSSTSVFDADWSSPDAQGVTGYTPYNNGNFYEFGFTPSEAGYYLIVVAESADAWAAGEGDYLVYACCLVQ